MRDTGPCQSDNCGHAHDTHILEQNKVGGYGVGWPGRHGGAQALLPAMGGPGAGPGSAHGGYQLCGGSRHKGHAPGREEGKTSLPQSPSLPSHQPQDAPPTVLTMPSMLGGTLGAGLYSEAWPWHRQLPWTTSSEGIVVEGVSLEAPLGPVTQCVQFEVRTEVSHMQELWRQIESPQVHWLLPLYG